MDINMDAARAARDEAEQITHTITFGGETFELPVTPEWDFVDAVKAENWRLAIGILLGPEAGARFWAHKPDIEDVKMLDEEIARLYFGGGRGKSRASGSSSKSTSRSSRQRSQSATPS